MIGGLDRKEVYQSMPSTVYSVIMLTHMNHSCSVRIKRIVRSLNNSRIVTNCLTRTNFRFLLYSE